MPVCSGARCVARGVGEAAVGRGSKGVVESMSAEQRKTGGDLDRPAEGAAAGAPVVLAEELTGTLRCASCRYDLRGLSVKGECPECGLPIQATLLSIIDPMAEELRPIESPRLVAAGLVAWAVGGVVAVALGWLAWLSWGLPGGVSAQVQGRLVGVGAAAVLIAGAGAAAAIRPHAGIPLRRRLAAGGAVLLYPVLAYLYIELGKAAAAGPGQSLLGAWTGTAEPTPWRTERLCFWLTLAAIGWLLRGNLRVLASRSLVLRAERVDRQTIAAGVAALLVAALGDTVGLLAGMAGTAAAGTMVLLGEVLVMLGSALMSLGVIGLSVDTFRLLPAVIHRPLARRDVVGPVHAPERGGVGG